ncbi:MAG TPA: hypothetical protein VHM67_02670, partial [Gemmatimonadaceae bacterium]|nr:hypothetical protein [Gemmatimonadaceae bacterium]
GKFLSDTVLYASITSAAQRGDSLLKLLTNGQGTASKLLTDQELYEQLTKALTDLNAILTDVRRDPKRYTRGIISVF